MLLALKVDSFFKIYWNMKIVNLNPDQAQYFVGAVQGPSCL